MNDAAVASVPGDKRKTLVTSQDDKNPARITLYLQKIGSINFLAKQTRPDLSSPTGFAAKGRLERCMSDESDSIHLKSSKIKIR